MKTLRVIIMGLMCVCNSYGQDTNYQPAFWNFINLNGKIELLGTYRNTDSKTVGVDNKIEDSFWSGRLDLNTQSYFWHPNFMILNVGGTYFPGAGQNNSVLQPDYAIESVSRQLRLNASIFRKKQLNYQPFFNIINSFSNAENISETKNDNIEFGGQINYNNKIAPLHLNYLNFDRQQEQQPFKRKFSYKGSDLTVTTQTSFGNLDTHDVKFSHRNYTNALLGIYSNSLTTTTLHLNDRIYFDKKKNKSLNSNIINLETKGFNLYKRFSISENLMYALPSNFNFSGSFSINKFDQNSQKIDDINYSGTLKHQLYESLNTYITFESRNTKQTAYKEFSNFFRSGFIYTKKLPYKSKLFVSYNYDVNKRDRDSKPIEIQYFNESFVLNDTEVTLIPYPNVQKETIVVKDVTGTLIYQEDLDYIIINNNNFYQIQRLPGGLISDNTQVYIDFVTQSTGSFNYISITNRIQSQLSVFNNLCNIYYKHFNTDYKDINVMDTDVLNYINQNIYGIRIQYDGIQLGAEKDLFDSNIVPYRLNSYFLNINGKINKKLTYLISANIKDYDMIGEEGRSQLFISASGNLTYFFNYKTKLNINTSYRKQEGVGIDLDLFTSRAEFSTSFNKLTFALSADLYKRKYLLTEDYNFKAINLRITRIF